jgi:hypothetical protein
MSPMQKLVTLLLLASLPAAAVACATGATTADVTADVSFTEADAAPDGASSTRLPPGNDASTTAADPDATSAADASSSADGAADGATDGAATDAAVVPDSSTTSAACGAGFVQIGEYATWYGKVNVHRAGASGTWTVDTDCTSGADVNTVAYCQKFWPTTTKQAQLAAVTADNKPFTSGGGASPACGGVAPYPGQNQFACCAP